MVELTAAEKLKLEQDTADAARKTAAKQNPLLAAKTDAYVDDNSAYQPRITNKQKHDYWEAFSVNKTLERPLPPGNLHPNEFSTVIITCHVLLQPL